MNFLILSVISVFSTEVHQEGTIYFVEYILTLLYHCHSNPHLQYQDHQPVSIKNWVLKDLIHRFLETSIKLAKYLGSS